MRIGYVNPEYNARRNIIDKCPMHKYVRVRSLKSLADKVKSKLGLLAPGLQPYVFRGGMPEDLRKVDLCHFWNNIALWPCRTPYITSFEAELPRKFPDERLMSAGFESMMSNQCRKLIAFSKITRSDELAFARSHGVSELDKKITVVLPPQELLVSERDMLQKCDVLAGGGKLSPLRMVFVGKDFFRKGGAEIVRALVKVRKECEIEAYLIGDFDHVDYASSWDVDSADEMRRLFSENSDWLHHYKSMPNNEVLALAKTCHIGLLPTRDDTFGYSVLEFQACGLPCITTDIRALPEINNDDCGWMIKGCGIRDGSQRYGEADYSTSEKLRELSEKIEAGVYEACVEIASIPSSVREKGIRALARIRREHDPVKYGARLEVIYKEALA